MRSSPASGYVVLASKLTTLLPESAREEYTKAIADQDEQAVTDLLDEHLPEQFPQFNEAYTFKDEDEGENMVAGEVYVTFDESDLFKPKELNAAGEFLKSKEMLPTFERWTIWG